jgi:hypothetical protein
MSIPEMPDDFWPEILVVGRDGNNELAFAVLSDVDVPNFKNNLRALRLALWQERNSVPTVLWSKVNDITNFDVMSEEN